MSRYSQRYLDDARGAQPRSAKQDRAGLGQSVMNAVRAVRPAVLEAIYAYSITGNAVATVVMLAGSHLDCWTRSLNHGRGC
jgi:hypothetical protein